MGNNTFAVLTELGILSQGTDVTGADQAPDTGAHAYRGHHQFCRFVNTLSKHPFLDPSIGVFDFFHSDTTVAQAMERTKLVIFLGASNSPELNACLDSPSTIVLIFEPDSHVLESFLAEVSSTRLAQNNGFLFTGAPYTFDPALQDALPPVVFEQGTPVFFQTQRIGEEFDEWATDVVEYLEILHFRHAVHPIAGQTLKYSRPIRSIKRDLMYDQQIHAYENIGDYLTCPDITQLKDRFEGHTAILVAAGPALAEKLDYIKRNRSRAVIISVNNALKPLVEAGIRPHFTVINDTSIDSGEVFKLIPKQPGTILVAHCLSDLGGDQFMQKYLFGEHKENIFGTRPDIELHGSVITTAFSLASHMGCKKCIIAGGQLSSENPWRLDYAKGTTNFEDGSEEKPLINQYPQMYPAKTPFGKTLYTTPNFRDAALWLAEVIRLSGIECINTSQDSILYGETIRHESEPELPKADVNRGMADLFKPERPTPNVQLVLEHIQHEIANWQNIHNAAVDILKDKSPVLIIKGSAVLGELDKSNVSFLVERNRDFNNQYFMHKAFKGSPQEQIEGYSHYYECLERMSREFLALLAEAEKSCRQFTRTGQTR